MTSRYRYSLRTLFAVSTLVALFSAVSLPLYRWSTKFTPPTAPIDELEEILCRGSPVVEAVEAYRLTQGYYPEGLEDIGLSPPWTPHGYFVYEEFDGRNCCTLHVYLGEYDTYQRWDSVKMYWYTESPQRRRCWTIEEARQLSRVAH